MNRRTGRNVIALAAVAAFAAAAPAQAEEGKVEVVSEVVLASNEGTTIDPPKLAKLRDELAKMGVTFSSFRRLSESKVTVEKSKPARVNLPDGRAATLKLLELKDGVATVNVTVPRKGSAKNLVDARYQLGRSPVTIGPIDHDKGKLILILSPPDRVQPRRADIPVLRPVRTPVSPRH